MLRGGNVAVISYCLGFHVFRLFHAVAIAYVASCQILLIQFNAVKWSFHEQQQLYYLLYCVIHLC